MGICRICRSSDRLAIEEALVRGGTIRGVAAQYGIGKSSLADHRKRHLIGKALAGAMQRAADINADGLFRLIGELQEQARRLGRKAEKEKNYSAAIAALRELSRHVELLGAIATMPGARTELSYGLRLEIGGPGRGSEEYSVQPLTAEELAGRPALPAAPEPGAGPLESAVEKAMQATSEPIEAGPEPAPSRGGSVRVPRPVDGGHRTTPAERAQWRDWQEEAARDRFSGF